MRKGQRDYEWANSGAREEGREEGKLTGKIQILQELLGDSPTTDEAFQACDVDSLTSMLAELQQRLRERKV